MLAPHPAETVVTTVGLGQLLHKYTGLFLDCSKAQGSSSWSEATKKLKELLDADARASPRMRARTNFISVCANPELPKEFQPVCQREDAPIIFNRLIQWVETGCGPCEMLRWAVYSRQAGGWAPLI
uniref:Guanylate cyclase activator 2B n=1 Tax=Chelydra serpentina TaxID=8475 RepID=A0A8C3SXF3_CHESE